MDRFDPYREWLGIEPHEQPADHYRLLGVVRFESDPDVILKAADERMRHVRSFQTGPRGRFTQDLLNRLAAAKLCLLDPQSRALYDQQLVAGAALPLRPQVPFVWPAPPLAALPPGSPGSPPHAAAPLGYPQVVPPPVASPPVPPPPPPPRAAGWVSYGPVAPPPAASPPTAQRASASAVSGSRRPARRQSSAAGCVVTLCLIAIALLVGLYLAARSTPGGWFTARPGSPPSAPNAVPRPGVANGVATGNPEAADPAESPDGPVVVVQEGNGDVNLTPATAVLYGDNLRVDSAQQPEAIVGWSASARAEWHFRLARPDAFLLELRYALEPDAAGGRIELSLDGRPVKLRALEQRGGGTEVTDQFYVEVDRSGRHRLSIRPGNDADIPSLRLRQVRLLARQRAEAEP